MAGIKSQFIRMLDRAEQIGTALAAAGAPPLSDAELWALAYANAPVLFLHGSLDRVRAAGVPEVDDLLGQLREAYDTRRS